MGIKGGLQERGGVDCYMHKEGDDGQNRRAIIIMLNVFVLYAFILLHIFSLFLLRITFFPIAFCVYHHSVFQVFLAHAQCTALCFSYSLHLCSVLNQIQSASPRQTAFVLLNKITESLYSQGFALYQPFSL